MRTIGDVNAPFLRNVVGPFVDDNGLGVVRLQRGPAPNMPVDLTFFAANGSTGATLAPGTPHSGATLSVTVADEAGAAGPAYLVAYQDGFAGEAVADASGAALVPINDPTGAVRVVAYREGYLSLSTEATASGFVAVRILSSAVAPQIAGQVTDAETGSPVRGAALEWRAGKYEAHVLARPDGTYAVPATGYGTLTVRAPTYASASFLVAVTGPATTLDIALLKPTAGSRGVLAGGSPPVVTAGPATDISFAVDGSYYSADLPDGVYRFSDGVGLFSREVMLPGALPLPLAVTGQSFPFFGVPGLTYELRCGDLRQAVFGGATVASACWSLYASDGLQDYFLGAVDPGNGFSADPFFSMVSVGIFDSGVPVAPQSVTLTDELWNRTIQASVGEDGILSAPLPHGIYSIRLADGTVPRDAYGNKARIHAYPGGQTVYEVYTP